MIFGTKMVFFNHILYVTQNIHDTFLRVSTSSTFNLICTEISPRAYNFIYQDERDSFYL